ncbi:MAG: YrzE family protein [Clostridia bacterium]|nr:YrzE family protein [Clostridia bacterium]
MPKHLFGKLTLTARTALTVGIAMLFAISCCLLFCFVAKYSEDPTANLQLFGEIAFALSMLFCGFLGAKLAGENRFAAGMLASGVMLLPVTAAAVVCSTSFVRSAILLALGAFVAAIGALLGAKESKRRRKH